jgi:hypothetical protein
MLSGPWHAGREYGLRFQPGRPADVPTLQAADDLQRLSCPDRTLHNFLAMLRNRWLAVWTLPVSGTQLPPHWAVPLVERADFAIGSLSLTVPLAV